MKRYRVAVLFLVACQKAPDSAPPAHPVAPSAQEKLDKMDERRPVPLLAMMANHQKENMRDHLVAVQGIVAALASDDYAAVEHAAKKIGYSEQEAQMCNHMGAGAPGFTEQALVFHRTADKIVAAAQAQDKKAVLTELSATLQTCTGCHAQWKQQVVDADTFEKLKASAPASAH